MENKHKAVAINYSDNKKIPEILAIARGILADRLLEVAKKMNIPIYKDSNLAESLSLLDVGIEIPPDLFQAMAEVLSYCFQINEKFRKKIISDNNS